MKFTLGIVGLILVLFIGIAWWSTTEQNDADQNIVSESGFHWHPELTIYVKGEKQEIPQGVGLTGNHKPIHTHDDLPIIHMEFGTAATADEVMLGQFFKNWDKDFYSFGSNVTMTVNGEENTEFEKYQMKNGDKIELRYE